MGRCAVILCIVVACGGGAPKKEPEKPVVAVEPAKPPPPPETEEDREAKRHAAALAIVPDGSSCLPVALKDDNAPRLELAAPTDEPMLCAIDIDKARRLGNVGCWKVENLTVEKGTLAYQPLKPLAAANYDVQLADRCARGYCLPKDAKIPADKTARMSWNLDGSKVAILVGDDVHLFDTSSKSHDSTFSIRGDKGLPGEPSALHFAGDAVFVEGGSDATHTNVWVFKTDGSQLGVIEELGGKKHEPVEIHGGSFSLLDDKQVALSSQGFSTVTTYEIKDGKRAKLVRKLPKVSPPCKGDEVATYWSGGDKVPDKCRDTLDKVFGHYVGAEAVRARSGKSAWLVLLRGSRLGELAVLDPKTLAEKRSIKLPWCAADKSAGN
jgi:hypothetical protein